MRVLSAELNNTFYTKQQGNNPENKLYVVNKTDKTIEAFQKLLIVLEMCYVHKHIKGSSLSQGCNNWVVNGAGKTCTKELRQCKAAEF